MRPSTLLPSAVLTLTFAALSVAMSAQTPPPSSAAPAPAPAAKLLSGLFEWDKLTATPTAKGFRRDVFDGPTATVDKMHCHITTLNPGEKSGEPSKHLQEEVILVKEGTLEANWDGQSKTGGPGSVIFFAAGATTFLRNAGATPCTYVVIYYYTPLTPKR
jgi:mannose-6-phosphate isomerase-like protein (cupin superfamily)